MNQILLNKIPRENSSISVWLSKLLKHKARTTKVETYSHVYIRDFITKRNSQLGKQLEEIEYEIYTRNQSIYLLTNKNNKDGDRKTQ